MTYGCSVTLQRANLRFELAFHETRGLKRDEKEEGDGVVRLEGLTDLLAKKSGVFFFKPRNTRGSNTD